MRTSRLSDRLQYCKERVDGLQQDISCIHDLLKHVAYQPEEYQLLLNTSLAYIEEGKLLVDEIFTLEQLLEVERVHAHMESSSTMH